jgi:hypothetical protein
MDIRKIKKSMKVIKGLGNQDEEVWDYVKKPIGKAYYLHHNNNIKDEEVHEKVKDKDKIHWSDKLKCKICGRDYVRSNISNHKKTKYHLAYENINDKVQKFIIG